MWDRGPEGEQLKVPFLALASTADLTKNQDIGPQFVNSVLSRHKALVPSLLSLC